MLALAACSKPSDKAKREYQLMLKGGATLEEKCAKMQEIAAAYLAEENEDEYPMAKAEAGGVCLDVQLDRLRG